MGFFVRIKKSVLTIPVKVEKTFRAFSENLAIIKKRKIYKKVKWTKEQKKQFDDFWKINYGKKISSKWHRLYEAMNGVFNVQYFPEKLSTTKLEFLKNDFYYCSIYEDKNLNDILFNNRIKNVRTPRTYFSCASGICYDGNNCLISKEDLTKKLSGIGEAVIKPATNSCSGKNIKIVNFINGINVKDGEKVENVLKCYGKDFIIQEKVKAHNDLKTIYPNSINTFRVITYILNNEIKTAPVVLRIGSGGGEVDNIHAGGIAVVVDNDGEIKTCAYKLGYGDMVKKYEKHPDTGVQFAGYKIPLVKEIVKAAKELHKFIKHVGLISWDLTLNDDGEVVVIEANYQNHSVWFPQIIFGQPIFGQDTARILQSLGKSKKKGIE